MLLKDFTYERRTAGLACHHHFLVKPHIFSCLGASIDQHFRLCQIDTILPVLPILVLSQIHDCSFLIHPLRCLLSAMANSDWGWNRSLARIPLIASLSGRREAPAAQAEAKAGMMSTNFEDRYRCKDGSYRWLSWSTIPYPEQNLMYGIARDVTDRKLEEAERQRNQVAIEERNQELDSFVYVVSHDLKAPLRAVANLSQWIEDDLEGELTANTRSQMTQLRNRVERMSATIDGLLDYARIGRSEGKLEPVAVARLLADVVDSVAPPPTFTIDLPTELPTLFTRRVPLFQVFVNLVGNGIKHHHSEAGTIGIACEEQGDFYEFAIADDGPGIAPADRDRMFQIFQAVNPQKRSDSTGIGLAITSGRLRQRQKNHRSRRRYNLARVRAGQGYDVLLYLAEAIDGWMGNG